METNHRPIIRRLIVIVLVGFAALLLFVLFDNYRGTQPELRNPPQAESQLNGNATKRTSSRPHGAMLENNETKQPLTSGTELINQEALRHTVDEPMELLQLNGSISKQFIKEYGLSDEQKIQIENKSKLALKRLKELQADLSVIVSIDQQTAIIKTPAFPKLGGEIYDEVLIQFRQCLGDDAYIRLDRSGAFNNSFGSSITYQDFGLASVQYEISIQKNESYKNASVQNVEEGRSIVIKCGLGFLERTNSKLANKVKTHISGNKP